MKSKLLSKLTSAPGINIFNHRNKMEYSYLKKRIEPSESHSFHKVFQMATQYFQDLVVQDQYVKAVNKLLDEFSFEVEKWDMIQANHEAQIEEIKSTCKEQIVNSKAGRLNDKVAQLEAKNKRLENRVADLERQNIKVVVSEGSIDNLNATLIMITNKIYGMTNKDAQRIKNISSKLESFFKKIKDKDVYITKES